MKMIHSHNRTFFYSVLSGALLCLVAPSGLAEHDSDCIIPPGAGAQYPSLEIKHAPTATTDGYTTTPICIGNSQYVALIPRRLARQSDLVFSIKKGDKVAEYTVIEADPRLGLIVLAPKGQKSEGISPLSSVREASLAINLMRGTQGFFPLLGSSKIIEARYIAEITSFDNMHFPLPLLLMNFDTAAKPSQPEPGTPCYTADGRLIGIALGVASSGQCFLLPSSVIQQFLKSPLHKHAVFGCTLDPNSIVPEIKQIMSNGPLAQAGVLPGDIILKIGDTTIHSYRDFLLQSFFLDASVAIEIQVLRGTQIHTFSGVQLQAKNKAE